MVLLAAEAIGRAAAGLAAGAGAAAKAVAAEDIDERDTQANGSDQSNAIP